MGQPIPLFLRAADGTRKAPTPPLSPLLAATPPPQAGEDLARIGRSYAGGSTEPTFPESSRWHPQGAGCPRDQRAAVSGSGSGSLTRVRKTRTSSASHCVPAPAVRVSSAAP